jgi:tRNA-dihydrouridine synthase A
MTAALTPDQTRHRFAVAPMMDYTDRHCRFALRLISRRTRLYTEMVTAAAIVRGRDATALLAFDPAEQPVTLQLGGSDPAELASAARIAEDMGYDEVNLNVGCPSDRVVSGRFGACLMAEPTLVAECMAAMAAAVKIPVTIKTRIGIARKPDRAAEDAMLETLVEHVAATGCTVFIVHARKAWLDGLSPKENREIPPLDYARVVRLKRALPHLTVGLNGGLRSLDEVTQVLGPDMGLDGVMLGRAVMERPYMLAEVDRRLYGDAGPVRSRAEVVASYMEYAAVQERSGQRRTALFRPLSGLFHGAPGARRWRQTLSRFWQGDGTYDEVLRLAVALDRPQALAA